MSITRRAMLGTAAAAMTAVKPAFAQDCRIGPPKHEKGPLVFKDYDQVELDAAYKQELYQPLGGRVQGRLTTASGDARDHVGQKPLFFFYKEGVFGFASEIKALLRSGRVKAEMDTAAMNHLISLRYLPGTHIPILPPEVLGELHPDYVLILPWNLREEIAQQLSWISGWGAEFVVATPELTLFSPGLSVAVIGQASGSMIRKKMAMGPAPSSRAHSSNSFGSRRKYPAYSSVAATCPPAPNPRITPRCVLSKPSWSVSCVIGMIVYPSGMKNVTRNTPIRNFLPMKSYRPNT